MAISIQSVVPRGRCKKYIRISIIPATADLLITTDHSSSEDRSCTTLLLSLQGQGGNTWSGLPGWLSMITQPSAPAVINILNNPTNKTKTWWRCAKCLGWLSVWKISNSFWNIVWKFYKFQRNKTANQRAFNSLRASDALWHHRHGSTLVKAIACPLFSAKPLTEPILNYCQLVPRNNFSDVSIGVIIFIQANTFQNIVCSCLNVSKKKYWPWSSQTICNISWHISCCARLTMNLTFVMNQVIISFIITFQLFVQGTIDCRINVGFLCQA